MEQEKRPFMPLVLLPLKDLAREGMDRAKHVAQAVAETAKNTA